MLYRENRKTVNIPICKVNQKFQSKLGISLPSFVHIYAIDRNTGTQSRDLDTPTAPPTLHT